MSKNWKFEYFTEKTYQKMRKSSTSKMPKSNNINNSNSCSLFTNENVISSEANDSATCSYATISDIPPDLLTYLSNLECRIQRLETKCNSNNSNPFVQLETENSNSALYYTDFFTFLANLENRVQQLENTTL
ncbi:17881_t:CDS:2 [Gigaspora margarita]|uniref:17881_t:CDS:1 n=1 Tax=Gigaspora margarita TaxID=4874 RepID=A0ABN7UQB2_GIGMA|nr:17881_t:CDS:2 [Gigaspora margarita]